MTDIPRRNDLAPEVPNLNEPLTDDYLFEAGVRPDLPEREPMPLPPTEPIHDLNPNNVGVEYRAMPGVLAPSPAQMEDGVEDPDNNPFAWLVKRPRKK